jgi:hypothetical protein
MADSGGEKTAAETIALLEIRLQRLEFYVTGSVDVEHSNPPPSGEKKQEDIYQRLQRIEVFLQKLAIQSKAARDALKICKVILFVAISLRC